MDGLGASPGIGSFLVSHSGVQNGSRNLERIVVQFVNQLTKDNSPTCVNRRSLDHYACPSGVSWNWAVFGLADVDPKWFA